MSFPGFSSILKYYEFSRTVFMNEMSSCAPLFTHVSREMPELWFNGLEIYRQIYFYSLSFS